MTEDQRHLYVSKYSEAKLQGDSLTVVLYKSKLKNDKIGKELIKAVDFLVAVEHPHLGTQEQNEQAVEVFMNLKINVGVLKRAEKDKELKEKIRQVLIERYGGKDESK